MTKKHHCRGRLVRNEKSPDNVIEAFQCVWCGQTYDGPSSPMVYVGQRCIRSFDLARVPAPPIPVFDTSHVLNLKQEKGTQKMRRRLMILAVMLVMLLVLSLPSSQPASAMMNCAQALQACDAQHRIEVASCEALGGSFSDCVCRANRIFNSCMVAHGCPSGQIDLEHSGCADN